MRPIFLFPASLAQMVSGYFTCLNNTRNLGSSPSGNKKMATPFLQVSCCIMNCESSQDFWHHCSCMSHVHSWTASPPRIYGIPLWWKKEEFVDCGEWECLPAELIIHWDSIKNEPGLESFEQTSEIAKNHLSYRSRL